MSSRKTLGLILFLIELSFLAAVFYAYVKMYQPLVEDTKKIQSSIADVTAEISTLDVSKQVDTEELVTNTANLQKKLPVAELTDQFVIMLEKVELASGSRIMSIAFNQEDNEEDTANTEEDIQSLTENAQQFKEDVQNLTEDNGTETEQKAVSMPAGIKKLSVTLSVESPSYAELERFIKELEELPRITKVESLSFSGIAEGDTSNVLTYSVVASTYYYPELTDLQNQLPDYEAPAPSKKTNPLYEAEEEVIVEAPQTEEETTVEEPEDGNIVEKNGKQYTVTSYEVQQGDTLFGLAVKFYNNNKGMTLIKGWNKLTKLEAGTTIEIPIPVDGEI